MWGVPGTGTWSNKYGKLTSSASLFLVSLAFEQFVVQAGTSSSSYQDMVTCFDMKRDSNKHYSRIKIDVLIS